MSDFSRHRAFLFILLAFIGGVFLRSSFAVPSFLILAAILAAGALFCSALWERKPNRVRANTCLFFALAGCAFAAGVLRFEYALASRPDLRFLYGKETAMRGVVWEDPSLTEKTQNLKVKIAEADSRSVAPFFMRVVTGKYPRYRIGDELLLRGVAENPADGAGGESYAASLAVRNIFLVAAFPKIEKAGERKGPEPQTALSALKGAFERNIEHALPEPHAAFLKGILLGDRAFLPPRLIEDFRRTGTSHVIALSGYNITIVGESLFRGLLLLTIPFFASFWIAVFGILFFVLLAGGSSSLVRAAIMGILVLVARSEGRKYGMTNALVFAGAVMIFQNPHVVRFDVGFQLSFLATAGLLYIAPLLEPRMERVRAWLGRARQGFSSFHGEDPGIKSAAVFLEKKPSWFFQTLTETLAAQIAVLPLILYYFGSVSVVSIPVNILVLFAIPYAMAAGFSVGMIGFLSSFLARVIGYGAWALLEYKIQVIRFFAAVPGAAVEAGTWMLVPLLFAYGGGIWSAVKNRRSGMAKGKKERILPDSDFRR